jgi:molybdenum cofactor cytidylyltransferase
MSKTGIIILAAGNSSRMGEPKQLMMFKGQTLLQHIIGEAKEAGLDPLICVTGFQSDRMAAALAGTGVNIVYNARWSEGMGSGIAAGIREVMLSDAQAVIIAVSDQPYVSADLFRNMLSSKKKSGKGIVACSYAGTLGTPVCFARKYFEDLKSLGGDAGAKKLVKQHRADVEVVEFPDGVMDIDTKADYEKLIAKY